MQLAVLAAHHTSQLWPTLTRIVTLAGAFAAAFGGYKGAQNHKVVSDVQVKLNGELHGKLDQLPEVTAQLQQATQDLTAARAELAAAAARLDTAAPAPGTPTSGGN